PEISSKSRLRAVEAVAKVDFVQVQLEDLPLLIHALDSLGQDELLELSPERSLGLQKTLTGQLLSNGAAALCDTAKPDVGEGGRDDAKRVEAAVLEEPLILDGHDRPNQMRRDLRERHFDALLLEDRERQLVRPVVDRGGLSHFAHLAHRFTTGKMARQIPHEPDAKAENGAHGYRETADQTENETRISAFHLAPGDRQLLQPDLAGAPKDVPTPPNRVQVRLNVPIHEGISKTFPVVLRPARATWAPAAFLRGNSKSVRIRSFPLSIQPNRSAARCCSSARVAM